MRKHLVWLVLVAIVVSGCGAKESKQGQPVQEGDYTTAPGGAGTSK